MNTRRQDDACAAFDELELDVHGVHPVDLQQFVRSRLSESDDNEVFNAVLRGGASQNGGLR